MDGAESVSANYPGQKKKKKPKNCDWVSLHIPFYPHLQNALNLTYLILLFIQEGL